MKTRTNTNIAVLAAGFAGLALALQPSWAGAQDGAQAPAQAAPAAEEARGPDTEQVRKIMEATKNNTLRRAININLNLVTRALELIEDGADVNTANRHGNTTLMVAAMFGQEKAVESLIAMGADLEAESKRGWTALVYAVADRKTGVVRILIDAGADLDTEAAEEALRIAVDNGHSDMVRILIDEGVDPGAVDLP